MLKVFIALFCILIVCCHAEDKEATTPSLNELQNTSILSKFRSFLVKADIIFTAAIVIFNSYHVVIVFKLFFSKPKVYPKAEPQSIAVIICARNEETVIGDLLSCIKKQDYPKELITTFVAADHCTDNTESIAREAGAIVYKRAENDGIGKGYVLRFILRKIAKDYPDGFDSYLFFDADNLIPSNFFQKMNDALKSGYDVVTSFRNSKNFGDSFVSASLSLWFMGESRIFMQPRTALGYSAWVTGTGFIMSRKAIESMGEWKYFTLSEDIEFTLDQLLAGKKIGYCEEAELFDEQPSEFLVAQRQRLRWAKGFLQVVVLYAKKIMNSVFQGNFGVYDLFMINMMCFVSTIGGVVIFPFLYGLVNVLSGYGFLSFFTPCAQTLALSYVCFVILGSTGTFFTWNKIHAKTWMKIGNVFYNAFFMIIYLPLVIMALFIDAEWKPIPHNVRMKDISDRLGEEQILLSEKASNKPASD